MNQAKIRFEYFYVHFTSLHKKEASKPFNLRGGYMFLGQEQTQLIFGRKGRVFFALPSQ